MTKRIWRIIAASVLAVAMATSMTACSSDADVASHNLSKDADNFKILRRIVFYNGVTGAYILVVEGYCSLGNDDPQYRLTVTCKTGADQYKKHFLGLSDNVTYFAEQIDSANVSVDHYKVIFKPETIVPDVEKR
jgi:hypothetical protein